MEECMETSVSVRKLVEFLLRSGDLGESTAGDVSDMEAGTKAHRKLQKEGGADYHAEVRLKYSLDISAEEGIQILRKAGIDFPECPPVRLNIDGICDGIILKEGEPVLIDEIKTTASDTEAIEGDGKPIHWAQALCYGFFYAEKEGLEGLTVRLTYYRIGTGQTRRFFREMTTEELAAFFFGLIEDYKPWVLLDVMGMLKRKKSAELFTFPYETFRPGQRELAGAVYRAVRDSSTLFAEAPTGIGKTASVLFGAMKTWTSEDGEDRKLFYLTARTSTAAVAVNAFRQMLENGFEGRLIALTAKEKICPFDKNCDPEVCPYSKGHYERVNHAAFELLSREKVINRSLLEAYAEKYSVCPFELSLDLSERCDVIVGDYNYVFDPRASLRRYFVTGGDYVLLTDEAHNLIDRGRDMFSCAIRKSAVLKAASSLSPYPSLVKTLRKLNRFFLKIKKETAEDRYLTEPFPALYRLCEEFCELYSAYLGDRVRGIATEDAVDLFFDMLLFMDLYASYDTKIFRFYVEKTPKDIQAKIFCADPSPMLSRIGERCRAVVYFSATLLPMEYCLRLLGGKGEKPTVLGLPSPFPEENLLLLALKDFPAVYKKRAEGYPLGVSCIWEAIRQKTANYLVFFPSFEYMENVASLFEEAHPEISVIRQKTEMSESEREEFLSSFREQPERTLVGFAVMGGIFSEGIDLTGDRLSGVILFSVGVPQMCFERDIIRQIFDGAGENGYDYSYRYPGFNRVLQAAGRVIRSEKDRGFVFLLDSRFLEDGYKSLLPPFWKKLWLPGTPERAGEMIRDFWTSKEPD